jgi:hypothetical protein
MLVFDMSLHLIRVKLRISCAISIGANHCNADIRNQLLTGDDGIVT